MFHCFHALLVTRLREAGLAEIVVQRGVGIVPDATPAVNLPIGAPPFMDDLCIPMSDDCPVKMLERTMEVARVLGNAAAESGFTIQYGPGKTEAIVALRGKGKKAAMAMLARHTEGVLLARIPLLPIFPDKKLRIVRSYKHLERVQRKRRLQRRAYREQFAVRRGFRVSCGLTLHALYRPLCYTQPLRVRNELRARKGS